MPSVKIKDILDSFDKAIIIDIKAKTIWVVKDKKVKVYSKKFYDNFVMGLDLFNMDDDTK